jgi:glutamyl-tRNA reductase
MFTLVGVSHHTAPLALRERVAIGEQQLPDALAALRARVGPGAIVSTCNRTEVYASGEHDEQELLRFLAERSGVDTGLLERHAATRRDVEAVRHLYAVASGVESMVVGESEVLGQVRAAFSAAVTAGSDDALLSRLFHTAIRTARRARSETRVGAGALSVSTIAAQQARALCPEPGRAAVLVIGAGEAGRLAAASLAERGVGTLLVTNRTHERAEALAAALGGEAVDFAQLPSTLPRVDVVLAASGAESALLSRGDVEAAVARREGEPLVILDIAMPRDVDPGVRALPGVRYLDLDDLQGIAAQNRGAREAEVAAVRAIVDAEAARFVEWWEQLQVAPTIAALTDRTEGLRRREVERAARRMGASPEQREQLDAMARALTARLLHDPIAALRERGDRDVYVQTLRALFRLDEPAGPPEEG